MAKLPADWKKRREEIEKQEWKDAENFKCGNCGNVSKVNPVREYTNIRSHDYDEEETPFGIEQYSAGEIWQLLFCPNCDQLNLRHAIYDERFEPLIIYPTILFPSKTHNQDSALFENYIDKNRLNEIRSIKSKIFDLTKLIQLCEELNYCYNNEQYLSTSMLVRAITDHVPPIFDKKNFSEVANNYGGSKSFKESMQHLELSLRKIADSHLHNQIRNKEVLPNKTQVNFSQDLDVLLSEVVRLLK